MFVCVSVTTNEIVLRVYWATSPFIPNVSSSGLLLEKNWLKTDKKIAQFKYLEINKKLVLCRIKTRIQFL